MLIRLVEDNPNPNTASAVPLPETDKLVVNSSPAGSGVSPVTVIEEQPPSLVPVPEEAHVKLLKVIPPLLTVSPGVVMLDAEAVLTPASKSIKVPGRVKEHLTKAGIDRLKTLIATLAAMVPNRLQFSPIEYRQVFTQRQAGRLNRPPSAVQRDHVSIAHFLDIVRCQGRPVSSSTIEN